MSDIDRLAHAVESALQSVERMQSAVEAQIKRRTWWQHSVTYGHLVIFVLFSLTTGALKQAMPEWQAYLLSLVVWTMLGWAIEVYLKARQS